jgi:hypothetical protein
MRNTDILKTVADCDTALADARQTKGGLQIRLTNAQFALEDHQTKTAELPGLLMKAQGKLAKDQERLVIALSLDAQELAGLEVNDSENRVRDLQNMAVRYNPLTYIERSRNYAYALADVAVIDEVIAELEAHKATLTTQNAA